MTETPNPNIVDTDTLTGEMRPIRRAVLALGSNLGERMASLQGALNAIADTPDVWITGVSPVYETDPVDCPPDAKTFLNAVVLIDTSLAASRLMDRALAIEDAFERERSEVKNAPRTLAPTSGPSCCGRGWTWSRTRSSLASARSPACWTGPTRAASSCATTWSSRSSDARVALR